jgi:hypothetical protein
MAIQQQAQAAQQQAAAINAQMAGLCCCFFFPCRCLNVFVSLMRRNFVELKAQQARLDEQLRQQQQIQLQAMGQQIQALVPLEARRRVGNTLSSFVGDVRCASAACAPCADGIGTDDGRRRGDGLVSGGDGRAAHAAA